MAVIYRNSNNNKLTSKQTKRNERTKRKQLGLPHNQGKTSTCSPLCLCLLQFMVFMIKDPNATLTCAAYAVFAAFAVVSALATFTTVDVFAGFSL